MFSEALGIFNSLENREAIISYFLVCQENLPVIFERKTGAVLPGDYIEKNFTNFLWLDV